MEVLDEEVVKRRRLIAIIMVYHYQRTTNVIMGALQTQSQALLNDALNEALLTANIDEDESRKYFLLYTKTMSIINEQEQRELLHPGRGHCRFDIRSTNNPLPKVNVCHFYMMLPEKFKLYCGLSVDEFNELLALILPQMLLPRNGKCEFTDQEQSMRVPRVNLFLFHIIFLKCKVELPY